MTRLLHLHTPEQCHQFRAQCAHQTLALVPTMGALHEGHMTLIDSALAVADQVIVSIFVNPTQFGPHEDFDTYPRTLGQDITQLEQRGVHAIFTPTVETLYPGALDDQTQVLPRKMRTYLCGHSRPHFFQGVSTVVLKLLNCCQPDQIFFGEKDYQQLAMIRQLIQDFFIPTVVHSVPTVRMDNGLALSSRNQYLSETALMIAPQLFKTLSTMATALQQHTSPESLIKTHTHQLQTLGFEVDYLSVCDPITLTHITSTAPHGIILVAAWLEGTRLIDNLMY